MKVKGPWMTALKTRHIFAIHVPFAWIPHKVVSLHGWLAHVWDSNDFTAVAT